MPVFAISNETYDGYEALKKVFEKGENYCMLGSSGVGKSTLLNNLSDVKKMKTDAISQRTNKGKHITSHRQLVVLENDSILIDNPGMCEVGIGDVGSGLHSTCNKIDGLSENCKFRDCLHTNEYVCAVIEAVEKGKIEVNQYRNYLQLEKEKEHFELSVREKRKKNKDFGKIVIIAIIVIAGIIVLSVAYKEAEMNKGKADAKAARIYAKACNKSESSGELYSFIKSME